MRVVPTARLPPAGVWVLPSTLNELTVNEAALGAGGAVAAVAVGRTVDVASTPVTTVAARAATTEDTLFNFSPGAGTCLGRMRSPAPSPQCLVATGLAASKESALPRRR